MTRKKPAPSSREIRQRHEDAIADLARQREALIAEIRFLEERRRDAEAQSLDALIDLLALFRLLEDIDDDAEWIRRKATIRKKTRQFVDRKLAPRQEDLSRYEIPAALAKRLHAHVSEIQSFNEYAHVTGDFATKNELQNYLLERYSAHLDVKWDGPRELLIEFHGRSAGHLPITALSAKAREAIGARLNLKPPG